MPFLPLDFLLVKDYTQEALLERFTREHFVEIHDSELSDLFCSLSLNQNGPKLTQLPGEILTNIIDHLSSADRAQFALVNKDIRHLVFKHLESKAQALSQSDEFNFSRTVYPWDRDLWTSKKEWAGFISFRKRLWDDFKDNMFKLLQGVLHGARQSLEEHHHPPNHPLRRISDILQACPNWKEWCECGVYIIQALTWPAIDPQLDLELPTVSPTALLIIRLTILIQEEFHLQNARFRCIKNGVFPGPGGVDLEANLLRRRERTTALETWSLASGFMLIRDLEHWRDFSIIAKYLRTRLRLPPNPVPEEERQSLLASCHGEVALPPPYPAAVVAHIRSQVSGPLYFKAPKTFPMYSQQINRRLKAEFASKGENLTVTGAYQLLESLGTREDIVKAIAGEISVIAKAKLMRLKEIGLKDTFDVVERGAAAFEKTPKNPLSSLMDLSM